MRLPHFAADEAARRFSADLCLEHLEEAAFLYEQRRGLYDDPQVTWLDIGKFEERLSAHLGGLLASGELALEICQRKAQEGEPGELYAAVCVFCRLDRRDLLGAVLKRIDFENAVRSRALRDAITDEMPDEWGQVLAKSLTRGYDQLTPIVAHYIGYRRLKSGGVLDQLITGQPPTSGLPELLWAWGRVGEPGAAQHVAGYLDHDAAAVRSHAAMSLLRRGGDSVLAACRTRASRGDFAMWLPLAASGGRSHGALLQDLAMNQDIPPDALMALGVLGDLGAVRILADKLTDEEQAPAAAAALQLITGAGLREDVFVPEVVEEDELFEDERQAYRETGETPRRSDGRPFGVFLERTSQVPDDWHNWLDEHKAQFDSSLRYRLGKPFSLGALIDTLVSPSCGHQVRSLASEELVIRYRIEHAFEPEMRVNEQKRQINTIARVCRAKEMSFQQGDWHFAGRRI
jgi:uncharacterized protein (TIGR02270 family)